MFRFINNSNECTKSELDLFYVPPTNTSIESGGWSQHQPVAILTNGPIEFNVSASENEYIHLNKTLLYLNVNISKIPESTLDVKDAFGPVNNFASSLFSQIDVSLKNESIETSNKTYAYKAYITDLLNYGEDAKSTFMSSSLFYKDTAGHMNDLDMDSSKGNKGLITRRDLLLLDNGSIDMVTRIHSDIFNSDRYLISGVDLNIKLIQNDQKFYLMKKGKDNFKVEIKNAILYVRKAKISSDIILAHSLALENATAKYPIKRVVVNSYTISPNIQSFTSPNLSNSILPTRVIVGMVDSRAFAGDYEYNPFNFEHFNLRQILLTLDSKSVPYYKGIELDFTKHKYIRGYYSLFEGIDRPVFINGNNISRDEYPNGYALFAFDISPDLCTAEHFNLLKTGNLTLDLTFDKNLANSITLIVYMEYDNMIEINKARKVFKDYQI